MGTIGDLERRAGLGASEAARTEFWMRFHRLEGKSCLDAGVAELKRMTVAREGTGAETSVKPRRQRLPPLTPEQVCALQAYAARHGRRWKSILNNVWTGGAPHEDGGILRGLRNTHGPTWLHNYRLPTVRQEPRADAVRLEQDGKVDEAET